MWTKGALRHCWWECKIEQSFWNTVWQFLTKLKMFLPYRQATMLLGVYPKEITKEKHVLEYLYLPYL